MHHTLTHKSTRRGFTLVEIVIVVTLLSIVLLAANLVSSTGLGVFRSTRLRANLDIDALRAVDRLSTELAKAAQNSLIPPTPTDGTSDLIFQKVVDFVDGEAVWGEVQQVVFEYERGEANDGVDNNGDGLADEGMLVMLLDAGGADEQRVVLCHGVRELLEGEMANGIDDNGNGLVDEKGFCLEWVDGVLALRLSIEEVDGNGTHVVRTLQTSVRMRNGI